MRPLRELNGTATCGAARGAGRWAAPGRGVRSEGRGAASGGASRGPGGSPPHSGPPGGGLGWSRNRRRCGTAPMRRPHTALPRVRTGTPRGKPAAARGGGRGGEEGGACTGLARPAARTHRRARLAHASCARCGPMQGAVRPTAPAGRTPRCAPHGACRDPARRPPSPPSQRRVAAIVPSRPPPSPSRAPPGPVHRAHLRAGRRQVEGGGPQLLGVLQAG